LALLVALGRLAREVRALVVDLLGHVAHHKLMLHLFPRALVPRDDLLLLLETRGPRHLAHRGLHVAHLAHDAAEASPVRQVVLS